jgi:hypothetical protein
MRREVHSVFDFESVCTAVSAGRPVQSEFLEPGLSSPREQQACRRATSDTVTPDGKNCLNLAAARPEKRVLGPLVRGRGGGRPGPRRSMRHMFHQPKYSQRPHRPAVRCVRIVVAARFV